MTTTTKERIAELILRSVEQSIIDFDHVFDADPIATEIAAEIDALTAQLAEAQHDLKAAMEITEGAQNRRRDEIVANEKLHAQLAEARAQIAALTAQLAEARAQIAALTTRMEQDAVAYRSEVAGAGAEIAALNAQIAALQVRAEAWDKLVEFRAADRNWLNAPETVIDAFEDFFVAAARANEVRL